MPQKDFENFLGQIVEDSRKDLDTIIVFDLTNGYPLYSNKQLEETNLSLYEALFVYEKGAEETGLNYLVNIQDALNHFGKITKSGDLQYSVFKLEKGTMVIYFDQLPDLDVAICFLAPEKINLGNVLYVARRKIDEIKRELEKSR